MENLLIDVQTASQALGIGRSKLYELMAEGKLPRIKIGRRSLIPADALRQLVQQLQEQQL